MIDLNDKDQVIKRLKELKAQNLPHMTIEKMIEFYPDFKYQIADCTEEEKQIIENELNPFLGQKLGYCIISEQLPYLGWGLAHGVLIDSNTGLSWMRYNYFKVNGKECRFDYVLQYHPDCYEIDEE